VSNNLLALHIGHAGKTTSASETDILRRTLDEALGTLAHVLGTGDTGGLGDVISEVD